jgi:hypothetical protein
MIDLEFLKILILPDIQTGFRDRIKGDKRHSMWLAYHRVASSTNTRSGRSLLRYVFVVVSILEQTFARNWANLWGKLGWFCISCGLHPDVWQAISGGQAGVPVEWGITKDAIGFMICALMAPLDQRVFLQSNLLQARGVELQCIVLFKLLHENLHCFFIFLKLLHEMLSLMLSLFFLFESDKRMETSMFCLIISHWLNK